MELHNAVDTVLRQQRRAMSSRELADEINRQGLYVRPSDGQPLEAKQVSARVRVPRYRDRFVIDSEFRIGLA